METAWIVADIYVGSVLRLKFLPLVHTQYIYAPVSSYWLLAM